MLSVRERERGEERSRRRELERVVVGRESTFTRDACLIDAINESRRRGEKRRDTGGRGEAFACEACVISDEGEETFT